MKSLTSAKEEEKRGDGEKPFMEMSSRDYLTLIPLHLKIPLTRCLAEDCFLRQSPPLWLFEATLSTAFQNLTKREMYNLSQRYFTTATTNSKLKQRYNYCFTI
ncbi:hypothetical protein CEXT_114961 [Caerostris extrusa]|uniref:Uncharacterized protein n=1 Tax=Caerostris extrusa TaxID=172846 RepID=A0AAV4SPS7_CAEEX|nr:hypothetical protein CEXT_114961 [Caerostris extrusa]